MCGIVGYVGKSEAKPILMDGLKRLEYRGYDSSGVSFFQNGELSVVKAKGKISELEKRLEGTATFGTMAIGHTRWATHGKPSDENAHPHATERVSLVHNGIIENYLELKKELLEQKVSLKTDTDTEIITGLMHFYLASGCEPLEALGKTTHRLQGSFAIACLIHGASDTLFVAKKNSPLVIGLGSGENMVASDIHPMISKTNRFVFLDDGEIAVVRATEASVYNRELTLLVKEVKTIHLNPVAVEKMGYKHFMQKEIFEQPRSVSETLSGRFLMTDHSISFDGEKHFEMLAKTVERMVIIACGTSYHAGLVGKFILESVAKVPTEVDLASEFRYRNPLLGARTAVVAISQSGETADTIASIGEAKSKGAKIISICNVEESTIARISDYTLYTHAGPEIGVASTKAFTTQLSVLYLIALKLASIKTTLNESHMSLLTELAQIPSKISQALKENDAIAAIAKTYSTTRDYLFLGRGINYPIALEGALKLKEISYIHAEGYPAGEMKHGPIALIDEEMPVVFIAPKGPNFEKIINNLEQAHARGGRIIVVSNADKNRFSAYTDHFISIPSCSEQISPLLTVIPLQLLAYHTADVKGTDVDQPRNLAKSVTVE